MIFCTERLRSLIDYENRAHHVFLFYSHSSVDEFYSLLYEGKFAEIAQQMQNFIRDYPVKGLILHGIEPAIKVSTVHTHIMNNFI